MPRRIMFRPSVAEQRRRVQAALNLYAPVAVNIGAKAKRERKTAKTRQRKLAL